jgi:hypothetical protein
VHEAILRQIIGQLDVSCQLAQEVTDLRLMTLDELAEGARVLPRNDPGNQPAIVLERLLVGARGQLSLRLSTAST